MIISLKKNNCGIIVKILSKFRKFLKSSRGVEMLRMIRLIVQSILDP